MTDRFSFKGWDYKELLRHNKDSVKAIIMFIAGYTYLTGFNWAVFTAGLVALLGKFVLDTFDYWLKQE